MPGISSRTATILPTSLQGLRERLCNDCSRSEPVCALLRLNAGLAAAIALRGRLAENFASSRVAGRAARRNSRLVAMPWRRQTSAMPRRLLGLPHHRPLLLVGEVAGSTAHLRALAALLDCARVLG